MENRPHVRPWRGNCDLDRLFAQEIYHARHLPRVRARGEREGGGRTLSSALLLRCSTTRVHRPAAPSEEPPLHLCLVVRTCRGAAPASPPLQASAIRICASAVTVCLHRPSACPQLPVHLVSPPPPAVCRPPSMALPSLCSSVPPGMPLPPLCSLCLV